MGVIGAHTLSYPFHESAMTILTCRFDQRRPMDVNPLVTISASSSSSLSSSSSSYPHHPHHHHRQSSSSSTSTFPTQPEPENRKGSFLPRSLPKPRRMWQTRLFGSCWIFNMPFFAFLGVSELKKWPIEKVI